MSYTNIKFDKKNGLKKKDLARILDAIEDLPNSLWELVFRKPKITTPQMRALHKFCADVAAELNGIGIRFKSVSVLSGNIIEADWDKDLVKERIWRPVQLSILKKKSTTKLTTTEVDKVAKPIMDLLYERFGIGLLFPSKLSQHLEKEAEKINPKT